jgi:ribonuclease Z
VVGVSRPGGRVVYRGDTRPCQATVTMANDANLLIHDATFGHDEADRARATNHATAREAAEVARQAGALRLALTHISSRYAEDVRPLEREARHVFPATVVAYDGLQIDIPFRDEAS